MDYAVIETKWKTVCHASEIIPYSGAAVLVDGKQIAVFRLPGDVVYAVSNFDPFSKAFVLSRGLVGDRKGEVKVASPIYKQSFSLISGQCMDDPSVKISTYPARVENGLVQIDIS